MAYTDGVAHGIATPDAGNESEAVSTHVSADQVPLEVLQEFRTAFSHIENPDDSICGWLTDRQQAALARMFEARGLKSMPAQGLSQLLDATESEVQQVQEFRALLEKEGQLKDEHANKYCTDLTLLKYLRARDHHLSVAHNMLVHTLAWRAKHQPWSMENTSSRHNKMSSDERVVGLDPQGRVVVYSSFSNTNERTPDKVTLNAVTMMEKTSQCIAAKTPGQVMWINHFCSKHKRGFGWSDANPRFFFSGINVFMDHYPECLKTMIIVDPPSIFFTIWKLIHPLLPAKTASKAEFVHSDGPNTRARFIELFGEELGNHLMFLVQKDNNIP